MLQLITHDLLHRAQSLQRFRQECGSIGISHSLARTGFILVSHELPHHLMQLFINCGLLRRVFTVRMVAPRRVLIGRVQVCPLLGPLLGPLPLSPPLSLHSGSCWQCPWALGPSLGPFVGLSLGPCWALPWPLLGPSLGTYWALPLGPCWALSLAIVGPVTWITLVSMVVHFIGRTVTGQMRRCHQYVHIYT